MPHASLNSPFGSFTVFEADGALVALEWGRAPAGDVTPLLGQAIEQLEAYFDGRLRDFVLPLRPRGTPFQRHVWSRLREIPYGETCSYRSLALDLATSPRALAGACASNPLPIIIPCHRVVSAAGGLGGYSGGDGVATKQALLRLEGAQLTVRPRARSSRGANIDASRRLI
jgi:methylated-DNA-[protein]-cysteine S-methyltransferase